MGDSRSFHPVVDPAPHGVVRPRRLAHANLFVSDLAASTEFYKTVAGIEIVFEERELGAVFLSNGNTHHDVALMALAESERRGRDGHVQVERGRGSKAGLNHLAWEMESEEALVAAYDRAIESNLSIQRATDHKISRSLYLYDIEGNYLEFYCDATNDWSEVYKQFEGQLISEAWDPHGHAPDPEPRFDADPALNSDSGGIFQTRRLARAVIAAEDLGAVVAFYRDTIGLVSHLVDLDQGLALLGGSSGDIDFGLVQARSGESPGLHHLSFELESLAGLEAAVERLAEEGFVPDRPTSTKYKQGIVVCDPDGIACEFFAPLSPANEWLPHVDGRPDAYAL